MLKTLRTLNIKEISMTEWCQNKKCPEKKNQNQIRGSKGAKYYQSNKIGAYGYTYWCSMGCREEWWRQHTDTCMNAVGFIDGRRHCFSVKVDISEIVGRRQSVPDFSLISCTINLASVHCNMYGLLLH